MTLYDFNALQASKAWKHFYFLTENQPDYDCTEPLETSLIFTAMDVMDAPPMSAIYFREGVNHLRVGFITAVDCEPHVLGDLLKITCGRGRRSTAYIVVAN